MTRRVLVPAISLALLVLALQTPESASAATCSDFANQAEAQRAANTRDADGDGIYCEALPCPCLKPGQDSRPPAVPKRRPAKSFSARIVRVIDGDTVVVRRSTSRRSVTVRLIGIDTPETKRPGTPIECGGTQASAHMRRLAPKGRVVRVSGDATQDARDRYGRLLAYVTLRGGSQLNLGQVSAGWSSAYVFRRPFTQLGRFQAAERSARAAGRGVWGACGGDFHRPAAG